jgi:serine/threonine protein kinase/osmotically-inducible protein OsmY
MYENRVEICQVDGRPLDDLTGDPVVGRTLSRRYRMIRKLGGGDLGAVYQAEELATGNMVAVKLLHEDLSWDPEYVKQCRWEARFAAASNPANITRVYEVDQSDQGRVFIVMEYLEGHSLADVIRREGALEVGRALRLTNEIAQALATATKAGVTHRNLKPQNVMLVGPEERAKVTDFGVARLRETAAGGRLGRLGAGEYAAPEQLKSGEVTDRTDIYSLGSVLYTMLTGLPPSTPARSGAGGAGDLRDTPTPVRKLRPEIPVALEQFVMRAMDRQPGLRQGGIWEFIDSLRELSDAVALGATVTPSVASLPTAPPSVVPPQRESVEPGLAALEPPDPEPAAPRPAASRPPDLGPVGLRAGAPRAAEPESSPKLEVNGAETRVRYADLLRSRRDSPAPALPGPGLDHRRRYADISSRSRIADGWLDAAWWQSRLDAGKRLLPGPELRSQAAAHLSRLRRGTVAASERVRSHLASAPSRLAGAADRLRHTTQWQSSLEGWRRVRTGVAKLPLEMARWSSRPNGRMVLTGAAGLGLVAVATWAMLSWPGAGGRGSKSVTSAPTPVSPPSVVEQVPPVAAPEIATKPAVPVAPERSVTPERRRVDAARTDGDRARQLEAEAARRSEEQRRQAEVDAARRSEEQQRRQAEAEATRRAEEEQEERRRQAEAEAARRAEEVAAARRQAEVEAARARAQAAPPAQVARPAEAPPAKPPVPTLSAPELARIRAQAEQKLTGRGLLRVSSSDRWGVTVDVGSTGEVALSGTLRDLTMYQDAVRLVRDVPGVQDVKTTGVRVFEAPGMSTVQYDSVGLLAEIQARLRTRGLLRESATDRWGVTVEVGTSGDVTLAGVVRDAGLQGEAIRLVQGIPGVQKVKQDIRVVEGAGRQVSPNLP